MKRYLALVLLLACGEDEPERHLLIEHQPQRLAQATEGDWLAGSELIVDDGSAFPRPLTLKISLLGTAEENVGLGRFTIDLLGQGQLSSIQTVSGCVAPLPDVAPTYCTHEYDVLGLGSSMLVIKASSPDRMATDCFYYAIVDSTADPEAQRTDLEARAQSCRDANR